VQSGLAHIVISKLGRGGGTKERRTRHEEHEDFINLMESFKAGMNKVYVCNVNDPMSIG
jgi:hypothetical protein